MTRYNLRERIADPRVRNKTKHALSVVLSVLDEHNEVELSRNFINKHIGRSNKPLGETLRNLLLTVMDDTYRFGCDNKTTKKYKLNAQGAYKVSQLLGGDTVTYKIPSMKKLSRLKAHAIVNLFEEFQLELQTGNFQYDLKNDRNFHTLQFIRSDKRRPEFAKYGYVHMYDICTCAPMVFVTHALDYDLADQYAQPIWNYITNRSTVRQYVADTYHINIKTVKQLITSWFFGAPLSTYYKSSSMRMINDRNTIEALKNDPILTELRLCIKQMWKTLRHAQDTYNNYILQREYTITATGKNRLKRLSSKNKSDFYMSKELVIMNRIETYLKNQCVKVFREHDGWTSDVYIDPTILESHIRSNTKYKMIQIDYELVQHSQVT